MNIQSGSTYQLQQLGTTVKALAPTTRRRNTPMWEVIHLDGPHQGQHMDVPSLSLVALHTAH